MNSEILCSRIKHGVPPKASSGKGFLKGGDVKSATKDGPTPRAWAVGDGSGDDVEILCNPEARKRNLAGDSEVTFGQELYFFSVRANRRAGDDGGGPLMEYVLVYEYVTCGTGRSKNERVSAHEAPDVLVSRRVRVMSSLLMSFAAISTCTTCALSRLSSPEAGAELQVRRRNVVGFATDMGAKFGDTTTNWLLETKQTRDGMPTY